MTSLRPAPVSTPPSVSEPVSEAPASYHHGNLQAALLDGALALLCSGEAVTMRAVAKAAGVSHAAPYHHFRSLEALYAALAEQAFAELSEAMRAAANGEKGRAALVAICEAYVRFALARPAVFRLMFGPLLASKQHYPGFKRRAEESFGVLMDAAAGYAGGEGAQWALVGWSMAHGLSSLLIDQAMSGLSIEVPPPAELARALALRVLAPDAD